ncbi:NUDIX hydrolase [Emticicia oligotrophica]|uniref:NUDIX hydrolase n=1 Tax=Emticicia oligotrophica TaxID=312279 RepID=UPI00273C894F|nr:NUDIX domain-containing protein [Emticicia oligotrophica]
MKFSDEIIDALSIDCVIFGFKESELYVLLVKHGIGPTIGQWALPGSWIRYNESIDAAATRILSSQTSVENIYLEQFKTFGDLERFPNRRVITIAYYAFVNIEKFNPKPGPTEADVKWFKVQEIPTMAFDHSQIFESCFNFLQHKIQHEPIGFNLLPPKFTLLQLLELYEAILNQKLDKSNFRKKFLKMNLLVDTKERQKDVSHRAATLYRFDENIYNKLLDKGFIFEV